MSDGKNSEKRMQGRRVLVTGAGTGIGRGIALEFAREGADVVLHYSHSAKGALSAVEEIKPLGVRVQAIKAEFTDVAQVCELGRQAVEFLGGLDVLINNAGITANTAFGKVTLEQFDTMFGVNVRGQFFLTQAVLPAMERQGHGVVINLSSDHAFFGKTHHSVYAGTKGAIIAYTRVLALELAAKGIRVNCIVPGWVQVENQEDVLGDTFDWEAAGKGMPAGFVGQPRDIARMAIFLASDEGRYIVGQSMIVDGGQAAIMPLTGDWRDAFDQQYGQRYVPGL